MAFYNDVKDGLSPSGLSQWINSRSAFIGSYFRGERSRETAAMKGGTKIHALIEGGMIKAKHVYDQNEKELRFEVGPDTGFFFRGRPDSFEGGKHAQVVKFVDYKSGKENGWAEKLPTDIKMKATAWLVWRSAGKPAEVHGFIEYIPTTWNDDTKEVVPIDDRETEVISIVYTAAELENFTQAIHRAMSEVNAYYERWLKSSGEFVKESDTSRYLELVAEIAEREKEQEEIAERIQIGMEFGGEDSHKVDGGSFSMKQTKKWEYPPELKINYLNYGLVLEDAEAIGSAAAAAKKDYELVNDPVEVKAKVQFRAKPVKK